MKKIYFFLIALFVSLTMFAGEVTEQQALQKAQQFMKGKQFKQTNLRRAASTAGNAYYVFNVENNGGFIIVAGDDRVKDILGYSERGSFDLTKAPSNVRWWLSQYEKAVNNSGKGTRRVLARRTETVKEEIAPFITTTWGQFSPYNDQTPEINGEHCVTGCVATSMAQVMNYTKCPESATGEIAGYTTKTNQIAVPKLEATTFNWSNMTNSDIARLMRYCGQAVKMDYGLGESGSSDANIPGALIGKFGYDKNMRIVYRNGYNSETWENLIYNELKAGRPVIYGGQSGNGGHSFICHGYRDDMFYINWGWDGLFDGYFALTALNPDGNGAYGRDQTAIIGIQKSTGGDVLTTPKLTVTQISFASNETVTRSSASDNFTGIKIGCTLQNSFTETQTVQSGFALYQGTELKSVLGFGNVEFSPGIVVSPTLTFAFGANVPDGTYRIIPVYRESESAEWIAAEGSNYRYVEAVIAGNTLTMKVMPDAAHDERLKYNIISEDEVEVSAANVDIVGDVVVPDVVEIDGKLYRVTVVAGAGFRDCINMTSIKLPSGIYRFMYWCFYGCTKLQTITLPKSLKYMSDDFRGCNSLATINIEDGNNYYVIKDGAILTNDCKTLIYYLPGLKAKEYIIPEYIEDIHVSAFAGNIYLEKVQLSSKITSVSQDAFSGCSALKTVILPENLKSIENGAFKTSSITEITLPSCLETIGNWAFEGCEKLQQITIPQSVLTIGEAAFRMCFALKNVTIKKASPISINETCFDGNYFNAEEQTSIADYIYKNATLIVPAGRSQYFKNSMGWGNFVHIEEIDMPDVIISNNPFENINENQMILGHYRGEDFLKAGESGFGGGPAGKYKACIGVFKEGLAPFVGSKITAARFALTNTKIKNVKFWIGSTKDKQDLYTQDITDIAVGWNVVELNNNLIINTDSVFIGIEYESDELDNYPISYISTGLGGLETGCGFLYGPYGDSGTNQWVDVLSFVPYSGRLNIQCIVEGSELPVYDIHMMNKEFIDEWRKPLKYFKKGETTDFSTVIAMKDWGKLSVNTDYEMECSIDGTPINDFTGNLYQPIVPNPVDNHSIDGKITPNCEIGSHKLNISVKSIKGKEPKYPLDDTTSKEIKVYSKDMGRQKQLVQLYTSTWCQDALSVNNEIDLLRKENPNVVQVSLHDDEFSCPAGDEYYRLTPFAVSTCYNRYMTGGGLGFSGFKNTAIDDIFKMPAFADVHITSSYDKRKKQLDIVVKGSRNEEFLPIHGFTNLTVLLTEDDVVAPQYDSGNDVWISDYKHQAVLRTNVSAVWGDPIEWNGDKYEKHYSIKLNDEWNKDKMHIVAFLGKPFDGTNFTDIDVVNCNDFDVKNAEIVESQYSPVEFTAKSYSRKYGDENPKFEFTVEGDDYTGEPKLECEATKTSAVGEYSIVISQGTVDNNIATFKNGTLTIEKAPLKAIAKSYTIKQGEALPTFEATYEGFKNNETSEVLTKQPSITTTATSASEPGEYDITISGGEAQNYDISYVAGKLTIEAVEITPITGTEETSFKEAISNETDLENTVIDNTYYNVNAGNGDGYNPIEQALVLNTTTSSEQMTAIQSAQVGDASVRENYSGIIFEIPAGQGTITVDAKTVGTHVLNVQIGNGTPTQVQKSERGTADVSYNVSAPTYVYLYASTSGGSAARLYRAGTAGANSVLLYGYKVTIGGTGIEELKNVKMEDLKYFDLNGRKVNTPGKGVYIINGRKVVIK